MVPPSVCHCHNFTDKRKGSIKWYALIISSSLTNKMLLFLLLLASFSPLVHGISETWAKDVEGVLAHIVMGPLQPALRPAAFAQRNRTQIVQVQSNHFRAHVLQNMLQALDHQVELCPWPSYVSQEAVQLVVQELKALEFQAVWETKPHWRCPGAGGYLVVQVPEPAVK
jgi:hypothetical protein